MDTHSIAPFDLLLRNGHVIDPATGMNGVADVAIRDGRIAAVGHALAAEGCREVRDASGSYISAGWIDLHGHWYEAGLYGVNAEIGLNHGVTTAVDAGTAGFANFPDFRATAIDKSLANILAFVHISCLGLHAPFAEELLELRYAMPEETAIVVDNHRDRAVGVKIRIGRMTANHGNPALDLAIQAAKDARVPLMVHISAGADERYILDLMRPGDILTHCFHGSGNNMVSDGPGGFIPSVQMARDRGVFFDIGHGCGSFSWDTATRAYEHQFYPDTISTDIHRYSIAPPWSVTMPQLMSKFLTLGMTLEDVMEKTTAAPARVLGRLGEIGSLAPGAIADVVQFRIREGEFRFTDANMSVRVGNRLIEPELVVRKGACIVPGEIERPMRPIYPCDRMVFDAVK